MKTLQEILDDFNGSKVSNLSDGKLAQSVVGKKYGSKNLNKDDLFDSKRLEGIKSSIAIKENARKQLELLNQYYRQNQVCCSNCGTYGKESLMKRNHFNHCKRPFGFSDEVIYNLHLKGHKNVEIAKMCNLKPHSLHKILKKWKTYNNI